MKRFYKLVSLLLSICLVLGMSPVVFAQGESNDRNITFTATLDNPVITQSDKDQVVVMNVNASAPMRTNSIYGQITWDNALTLSEISNSDSRINLTEDYYNKTNGKISWYRANSEAYDNVTNLAVVTFVVPAGTAPGTYTVGMSSIQLADNYSTTWEDGASATATLTIQATPGEESYVAGLSVSNAEPAPQETVSVNVNVTHGGSEGFAAGEVKVSYDAAKLTFNEANSSLGSATAQVSNGVITLEDYGADKSQETAVYVLNFTANAEGATEVTLTSAAFSTSADAATEDLTPATLSPATVTLNVSKAVHTVTLPATNEFQGDPTVTDGEDYIFYVTDDNYEYVVSATVGGTAATVVENADGSYTVKSVTGPLEISIDKKTAKTYTVNPTGAFKETPPTNATYGVDYVFTLADDVAASTTPGKTYTLESITIDGVAYTGYSVDTTGRTYTIPGADIKGVIDIKIKETSVAANQFTVVITGDGAGNATVDAAVVSKDATSTLTITPEVGYSYSVSATMGGNPATVVSGGTNIYKVEKVTGNVIYTVTKTLASDNIVTVDQYVTVQNGTMWLVRFKTSAADGKVASGKVPTYDGENMFWSDKYNAYCYLVVASTLEKTDAKAKVNIGTGTAKAVDYGMDVNITGKVDANDAQLVYNMYQATYSDFATASMEKFLRADVNGDASVNVSDATAIITAIMNPTTTG